MPNGNESGPQRVKTGVAGLDELLRGGLPPRKAYLVCGGPGSGKTTLGFHYVTTEADGKEPALWITLGEPPEQLRDNAARMGFDLSGVHFLDLSPGPEFFVESESYDIFSPAEVERDPTTRRIVETVEAVQPQRVFIDSMTQLRYLSTDPFQFRRQALSLFRYLTNQGATVVFTSESSSEAPDADLQFLSDGIIEFSFMEDTRTLRISKLRGSDFWGGHHEMAITERGIVVFPRLVPGERAPSMSFDLLSSGIPELDELLHGGLERGTTTVFSGPSGVGKTTLGLVFLKEAAGRGERSFLYTFEEDLARIVTRSRHVNIPVEDMLRRNTLGLERVEPLRYSADAFARKVLEEVQQNDTKLVMIDSTSGYELTVRGCNLVERLHALGASLCALGVTVLLVEEVQEVTGEFKPTQRGLSYLADNIVFMRYLELAGHLRRAIGVLKKRLGSFEETLREFAITRYGVKIGEPLTQLRGILRGMPELEEKASR
ncbi:circadian clock protein KaiC [Desulfacinum hydrothermale DSM 13146]|uniref:non-specific serine/threonine protein kinase n=1 Tax=Desulfacinum hydrothermale DSM 13146 TaxID=1121390 RepID=A0A1W1XUM9_9BACT|nr:ATPase domain-containing protein [Desulfacinum hydrothermale]SMC27572.1 circadian clock protein KaiC [Desulfacinum hydrothermale DSM 13146]